MTDLKLQKGFIILMSFGVGVMAEKRFGRQATILAFVSAHLVLGQRAVFMIDLKN